MAAVATLAGFPPDPEQQMLLDAAFAIDGTGKSVAFEVAVIAPRQNLKTGFLKQVALGHLFVTDERLVVWSAHEFDTAQEALRDVEALIDGSDVLRRRVKRTNRGDVAKHGAVPEIEMLSGARLKFKTRTSGGGRGLSGRKVYLDESYALQAGQVGALMPVLMAQPNPQVFYGSSACRPESEVLWDVVQRGRAGGDPRLAYAEWCTPAPDAACDQGEKCDHSRAATGCGCDKPEVIRLAHSAVARGRIQLQTIVDLRSSMPPDEFGREVMGWHDEPLGLSEFMFDPVAWADRTDPGSSVDELAAFGVAVSAGGPSRRAFGAIGAAGVRPDGAAHVELVAYAAGSDWIVDRCIELDAANPGVTFVLDAGGPAGRFVDPLRAAGLNVITLTTREVGAACAWMADAINTSLVFHGPDPVLEGAVRGARRRNIGDGIEAIGRRVSDVDVSPLEAVTFAGHVLPQVLPVDDVGAVFM